MATIRLARETSEADRGLLTDEELARVVEAEIADRQRTAQQYQTASHPTAPPSCSTKPKPSTPPSAPDAKII